MATIQISKPVSNVVAKYVHNGQLLVQNADFQTVFQAVIDSFLTGGRTEQDTILCFGDFDLDGNITLDSLVKIILTGANITSVASAALSGMFQADTKNTIDIIGGTLEVANTTPYGIFSDTCTAFNIHGMKIKNAANHGINYTDSSDFTVDLNQIEGCRDDCITTLNSNNGSIVTNQLNVGAGLTGGSMGVEAEGTASGGSHNLNISNNLIWTANTVTSNEIGGIFVDSNAAQGLCNNISIRGNIITDMPSRGISVRAQGVAEWIKNVTLGGNVVKNCGEDHAISLIQVDGGVSEGDVIQGVAPTGRFGFGVLGTTATPSKNIAINGLNVDGVRRSAIYITDVIDWAVNSPRLRNVGTEGAGAKYALQTNPSTSNYDYENSEINDLRIVDDQGVPTSFGLRLDDAENIVVKGGRIGPNVTNPVTATGAGLSSTVHIEGLDGFVTEASNSETSAGATIVVTHGLARTPNANQIHLTPTNATAGADSWYVDTITATQFTIHCSSGATFDWEIKAAGSDV